MIDVDLIFLTTTLIQAVKPMTTSPNEKAAPATRWFVYLLWRTVQAKTRSRAPSI
jgi:hypothetical protein